MIVRLRRPARPHGAWIPAGWAASFGNGFLVDFATDSKDDRSVSMRPVATRRGEEFNPS
jgi:hypothetical protein